MKIKKQLLAFLLVFSMVLPYSFTGSYAADTALKISISDAQGLETLRTAVNNSQIVDAEITADITVVNFSPIGTEAKPVLGSLKGNGHKITITSFDSTTKTGLGLIGYAKGFNISNVGVEITNMVGTANIGGLIGYLNGGSITNCYALVNSLASTGDNIGGLVGYLGGGASVSNSFAISNKADTATFLGGVAGYVGAGSSINNSYSAGNNLYGIAANNYGNISNCLYETGVRGVGSKADNDIDNTQNTTKYTKDQLKLSLSYSGWDFTNTWGFNPNLNQGCPIQRVFSTALNSYQGLYGFGSGIGTESSPFGITSETDLKKVGIILNANYILKGNLALTESFTPIGTMEKPFSGSFNGGSYSISGLNINAATTNNVGLFGYTNGAVIENLSLNNPTVIGKDNVGGLVGFAEGSTVRSTIQNCSVLGGTVKGNQYVGGLAGTNNGAKATIRNTFSTANVEATASGGGGVIGKNEGFLYTSYANGIVTGSGILGAIIGISDTQGTAEACYYDISRNTVGTGYMLGTGNKSATSGENTKQTVAKKQPQLKFSKAYDGWNFSTVWGFVNGSSMPTLRSFGGTFDATNQSYFTFNSGVAEIKTIEDLDAMRYMPTSKFSLSNDLNLSNASWQPLFSVIEPFTGTFEGNNHTISNFIAKNPTFDNVGLFSANAGIIQNLTISNSTVEGKENVGALVGISSGRLINCSSLSCTVKANKSAGGLVGKSGGLFIDTNGTETFGYITRSNSSSNVSASEQIAGGLVGVLLEGSLNLSYSSSTVSASGSTNEPLSYSGGLVGFAKNSTIKKSYSTGTVSGKYYSGGFVGQLNTTNVEECYSGSTNVNLSSAAIKNPGFSGNTITANNTAVRKSYYDSTKSGDDTSGALPLSTLNMQIFSNFSSWTTAAWIANSNAYPTLNPSYSEDPSTPVVLGSRLGSVSVTESTTTDVSSGSSGGGGGGGGAIAPVVPVVPVVTDTKAKAIVPVLLQIISEMNNEGIHNAKLPAELFETSLKSMETVATDGGSPLLTLNIQADSGIKALNVILQKSDMSKIASSKTEGFKINSDMIEMTFNKIAQDKMTSKNNDISILAEKNTNLSDSAKAIIKDRPVYQFSITAGSEVISEFGSNGKVDVLIPYAQASNEDPNALTVKYIDSNNKVTDIIDSYFDGATNKMKFGTDHFSTYYIDYKMHSFGDVSNHWAKNNITFLYAKSVINGSTPTTFQPNKTTTRAEFVKMLAGVSGDDITTYTNDKFTDVKSGVWYENSVAWAYKNGIINGVSATRFAPNQLITREQMAVMINKYTKMKAYAFEQKTPVTFNDASSVSGYAKDSVSEVQLNGLMSGRTGNVFDPVASATKAETATVLANMIKIKTN